MSRVDGVDGDVEVQTPLFRAANPFLLSIRAEADGECPTLRDVVERHPHLTVDDVKRLNPHVAAGNSATPLEAGVELRTPTFLTMRGQPYGLRFRIHDAEAHILACEEQLNALLRTHNNNEEEKEVLPQRRVLSQLEEVAMLALSEATRQLPLIEEEIKKSPAVKKHLRHHVVVDAIKEKQKQLADTFSAPSLPLASFHHRGWVVGGAEDENHLTAANITTRTDEEEDFCMQHNTRWEFTFCRSQSLEEAETWAVLSCQRLTALMDALVCSSTHMWPNSRVDAAFMFVGDVFFVDDRHKGREGYEDATNNIRHFDPLRRAVVDEADIIDVDGEGAPSSSSSPRFHPYFARCEVRSAHNTTFGELCVKFGEYGVLRHCGGCDHYFHLSANQSLREMPRRERQEYPHRVKKRRDRVVRCHLCRQLPSTIALYQDELAAQNPSLLCPACCEILHGGDTAEERNAYIKVEVKEAGDYFVL